jgi:hypothetical protein
MPHTRRGFGARRLAVEVSKNLSTAASSNALWLIYYPDTGVFDIHRSMMYCRARYSVPMSA